MRNFFLLIFFNLILIVASTNLELNAQVESNRLAVGGHYNGTKYWGELSDNQFWMGGDLFVRWNITEFLSLHGTFGVNQIRMKTDAIKKDYPDYFDKYYPEGVGLQDYFSNRLITADLMAAIHIFPSEGFVPYLFGGIGYLNHDPKADKTGSANNSTKNIFDAGKEKERNGISFPVGLGIEFYLTDDLVMNIKGTYRILTTDYIDDIPDEAAGNGFGWKNSNAPEPTRVGKNGVDKLLTFGLGFSYYIFGETDYDKDGLSNSLEKTLGTDPLNPDTDGDGITDGDEYYKYKTDPLNPDTDGDGINDYDEIFKYKTDPNRADSDNDGLNDYDEIFRHKTDPLNHDTDGDGVTDGDEVNIYKTNPLVADTDGDGINDYDEIFKYKTNPLLEDTDQDGINDYDEIFKYKTDPLNKDTDDDGLSDGDEINKYKTDPLNKDTDGDGLSDGDEINKYKTDPLNKDTDNDGLTDGEEVNIYKTNPLDPDTDKDKLTDGHEVNVTKTNPLDPDTDKDAIIDGEDDCPLTPGVVSDEPGKNGCPAVVKVGTKMDFPDILFVVGKAEFNFEEPATALNLAKLLQYVNQCDSLQVKIEGHSSSEGNAKRNQTLSEQRAKKVIEWLLMQGVLPSKIVGGVGYGSSQPKVQEPTKKEARNMTKEEIENIRKQNRRITVEVVRTCGDI
ncbi:MAG: OmpA family protein [Ignavibacteria bacterium]|jgi:outer membrane protein OmpA-like peptidoglycan-associated protein/opacity protein-like surface antigen|nr:OmpA family protein [Ignavibacteria bacterium]